MEPPRGTARVREVVQKFNLLTLFVAGSHERSAPSVGVLLNCALRRCSSSRLKGMQSGPVRLANFFRGLPPCPVVMTSSGKNIVSKNRMSGSHSPTYNSAGFITCNDAGRINPLQHHDCIVVLGDANHSKDIGTSGSVRHVRGT